MLRTTPRPLDAWPQARAWVEENLAAHNMAVVGDPPPSRVRPWSMVAQLPVGDSAVWFKANGRGSRYEAGLLAALAKWAPDRSVAPIAVDAEHGWSLLPHCGPTLRETADDQPHQWEQFLAVHAALQVDLIDHVDEMIDLGVPHLPTDALPARFDALLDDAAVWAAAEPGQREALAAHAPAYRDACDELAATAVPVSLQHDDIHDGNVFVTGGYREARGASTSDVPAASARSERSEPRSREQKGNSREPMHYRFFDWGDAYVGHPFALLLVSLRSAAHRFTLPHGGPELLRLRDAYLEPWTRFAPREQLIREVSLALHVAKVARALSWQRALLDADDEALREWGDAVPGWLGELLEPDVI